MELASLLNDRASRYPSEDLVNPIDELDAEDGYDRFSKRTKHEFRKPNDFWQEAGEDEEEDVEDFYDRNLVD